MKIIVQRGSPGRKTLEQFSVKLLDKIINASSPNDIERYINVALKSLNNEKLNGYIIQRFIDRVTHYLNSHIPANSTQKENARIARDRLTLFRMQISFPQTGHT